MGDVTPAPSKRCPRCDETKTLAEFNRDASTKDGLRSWCRGCTRAASKAHHLANPPSKEERLKQAARTRAWKKANRKRAEAGNKAYRQRHRDRANARSAVRHALRKGYISKQPCEVCGAIKVEAHHDDYARRLEVRWLCAQHHAEADMERRARP